MTRLLLFCAVVLIMACNDAADKRAADPTTDSSNMAPANTEVKKPVDTVATTDPYALTAEELKDDSVFADGSRPASWSTAGIDDPVAFKQFLKRLQHWVANGSKDSVVTAVDFPLSTLAVKTPKQFLDKYDTYINDKVKAALKQQKLNQVFRNMNGAMIGSGQLWLGSTKKGYKIIAINNK